jgi:pimeloyl-ACP methyl ester carboxylesterase
LPPLPDQPAVEHTELDLATGVRVHVALAGPLGAPRVLAIHGWPHHWWVWRRVIEQLGDEVRIACPDLRGLGWSGWPADGDFRKAQMADDALATLDALGWDRALLVGHDWGGVASFIAALRAPERLSGVIVLGVAHPWQPPLRLARSGWRFWYAVPLATPRAGRVLVRDGHFVTQVLRGAWGEPGGYDRDEIETYVSVLREDGRARATEAIYRSFLVHDSHALGRLAAGQRLRRPARLLYGRRDPLGTAFAEGFERHGDDARLELLDGCGHMVPEERPAVVAEAIRALVRA